MQNLKYRQLQNFQAVIMILLHFLTACMIWEILKEH